MATPESEQEFYHGAVEVYCEEIISVGSYGKICRAKRGQLPCAAKLIHDIFSEDTEYSGRVIEKFEQECRLLRMIKHPNIIRFLGTVKGPRSQRLALLTELMDESLTKFLERSTGPLPYHTQLNICHDVALALAYLHANNVIFSALSSNCVLLVGEGNRAKLTGFMSSQVITSIAQELEYCPGVQVYMPLEAYAFSKHPRYSNKLDCFSLGVLTIQIITRQFPNPGDAHVEDPKEGSFQQVPERERRKKDIDLIDPNHPLLPLALHCLKERDKERPSAEELCGRLATLKGEQMYTHSVKQSREQNVSVQTLQQQLERVRANADTELRQYSRKVQNEFERLKANHEAELRACQQQIQVEKTRANQEELARMNDTLHQHNRDLMRQLEDKHATVAALQLEVGTLRDEIRAKHQQRDDSMKQVTQLQFLSDRVNQSWNVPRSEVLQIPKREIGHGAWGNVYSARFRGQNVAIKIAHRKIFHESTVDMLKREVLIMSRVKHPNVVRFVAAVWDSAVERKVDTPIIISELMDMNLRDAYKAVNLRSEQLVSIFCDVAFALHYLHQHCQPIIHRDISAPNVLLKSSPGGAGSYCAKVSDFGSANLVKLSKTAGAGAIIYCAPEMFPTDDITATPPPQTSKVDVFSYGILLLEVIAREMPSQENRRALLQKVGRDWNVMYELIVCCTKVSAAERPDMADILDRLNSAQ